MKIKDSALHALTLTYGKHLADFVSSSLSRLSRASMQGRLRVSIGELQKCVEKISLGLQGM